ncbi:hypothetical protein TNCV_468781 [Trichonephila clavipes]|nr:hypothetical protein TNCV_468781 [Trichonephila clavipes]
MGLKSNVLHHSVIMFTVNRRSFVIKSTESIQNAANETICENEGNKNIVVPVDGTRQKRGCTSLNGVVTVTNIDIFKVKIHGVDKKAEVSVKSYKHKNSLAVAVVEEMRPTFRDLSRYDLLKNVCMEKHKARMKVFIMSFGRMCLKQHLYRLILFPLMFMMLLIPLMMVMHRS